MQTDISYWKKNPTKTKVTSVPSTSNSEFFSFRDALIYSDIQEEHCH